MTATGSYAVIITKDGCTDTTECIDAVHTFSESISSGDFKYTIIPNPNGGIFNFRIDSKPDHDLTLKLVNEAGQVIEVRSIKSAMVNHTEQFDVSYLRKGGYHLVITSDKFQRSEKIVVQ